MIVKNSGRAPPSVATLDMEVSLEIVSIRLLEIAKGTAGGFQRMTMDDALYIAQIIRRRIAEN
ncbi:hypothetical protein [Agrobacterium vitis]|uniref:hypothetical protein n=1 Tax=Agrobacterium vitis TaxID=373 RepID=UPI003D293A21